MSKYLKQMKVNDFFIWNRQYHKGFNFHRVKVYIQYQIHYYEEIDKQLQSPVLSEAGKKKKLEEKKKIEEKLRNLQLQAAQELNKMKIEAEKKLVEKLKKAAERYAKRHGIDIILAKSPMAGIVYANPTIDITEQIIKEMNK